MRLSHENACAVLHIPVTGRAVHSHQMTSNGPPAIAIAAVETSAPHAAPVVRQVAPRPSTARTILGLVDDAFVLLLAVILLPLIIILAGAPIALLVRIVREILHRL